MSGAEQEELQHAQGNATRVDFLLAEARLALTFCRIARTTSKTEMRESNIQYARKAYDVLLKNRKSVQLDPGGRWKLDALLDELASRLKALGEKQHAQRKASF